MSGVSDLDGSPDPIYRLGRPARHFIPPVLLAVAAFGFGVAAEHYYLTHDRIVVKPRFEGERQMTKSERQLTMLGIAIACFVIPAILPITLALTSRFAIHRRGLQLDRRDRRVVRWDEIGPCHWGHYRPGVLAVPAPGGVVSIPIPEGDRARVEEILRRVGKWAG